MYSISCRKKSYFSVCRCIYLLLYSKNNRGICSDFNILVKCNIF